MARWITISDVQAIYDINPALSAGVEFNKFIDQAQFIDMRNLLGRDLYHDIIADEAATAEGSYPDLLDGVEYTFDGKTYNNPGVNLVLAWFTVARYRYASRDKDIAHGFGDIHGQNFSNSSERRDKAMFDYYRETAMAYWRDVEFYLNSKDGTDDEYTYWYCGQPRSNDTLDYLEIDSGAIG